MAESKRDGVKGAHGNQINRGRSRIQGPKSKNFAHNINSCRGRSKIRGPKVKSFSKVITNKDLIKFNFKPRIEGEGMEAQIHQELGV
ncbi:hypothetical protein E2562_023057 [Oryza meyeriana var. granulata]|uniref:Uncharacterized protein n=1 Tax=Oryza meyeriana var. granulata TaxID=110450 RepID=A0A6G1EYR6_9ORYZ|nr:hypothetical protein E2562_023057 [Oryza meyeriana var. granulata]